jgi:arginase
VSVRVAVLRGRTSDRTADGVGGAAALGAAVAERLGVDAAVIGEPGSPREAQWREDLRDAEPVLAGAADVIGAALDAGDTPALFASDCTIAVATLPALARRKPDVRLVWLDAHGDFNTPDTSASGYLGGMCLSAACGRWDAGFGAGVDPARVVLSDARDLDAAERDELERAGLAPIAPGAVAEAVRGERVFLHLDLDVLDPSEMPCTFPAPGGLSTEDLRALLAQLADAAELVGLEVTSMAAPAPAPRLAELLLPLLR